MPDVDQIVRLSLGASAGFEPGRRVLEIHRHELVVKLATPLSTQASASSTV